MQCSCRTMNSQCGISLSLGLCRASRLTRLQLRSKCTDPLLATIGGNCTLLQELNISLSEQVGSLVALQPSSRSLSR